MSAEYSDSENRIQNEILTFNRFLEESNTSNGPMVALLPTPVVLSDATGIPETLLTQSVDLSVLNDDNVATSSMLRNIVGIIIIAVAVVGTVMLVIRGRNLINKR
jgi:hypothetical protein